MILPGYTRPSRLKRFIRVLLGSTIHTDESGIYNRVGGLLYRHETINHGAGEYVRGDVTTNGIESVFALLKGNYILDAPIYAG